MIGTSFGRYDIEEELGQGGMSVVYRGVDTSLERKVAIKVLHAHLAKKSENRQRLHREAKAIARLKHPNILEIYDYGGEDAKTAYIVMEYVEGQNLKEFFEAHGPCPAEFCALIGIDLCKALAQAHDQGIIHRDLKPENVMVAKNGRIKLMDFGIAHVFDAETMTQTGSLLGSPAHMAPEMIEGELVDHRADIFALGTVLYWVATGELPFDGKSAPQILKRVLEGIYKNPESINPKMGQHLGDIIRGCLAYQPSERYGHVMEVVADLKKMVEHSTIEHPDAALKQFLLSPVETQTQFEAAIVKHLLAQGKQALSENNHQDAFIYFNRVLGYEPQNVAVQQQLQRLHNRHRPLIIAAVVLISAVGFGAWWMFTQSNQNQQANAEARLAIDNALALANKDAKAQFEVQRQQKAVLQAKVEVLGAHERTTTKLANLLDRQAQANQRARQHSQWINANARRLASQWSAVSVAVKKRPTKTDTPPLTKPDMTQDMAVKPPEVTPPKKWTYRFKVLPPTASLIISGKQKTAIEAMSQGVSLDKGRHQLKVAAPGCIQNTHTVNVQGPQPDNERIPIVLTWRPGIVQIKADIQSTIFIDGVARGTIRPPQVRAFSFPFGKADKTPPNKKIQVVLYSSKDMTRRITKTVKLRPGSTQVVQGTFLKP